MSSSCGHGKKEIVLVRFTCGRLCNSQWQENNHVDSNKLAAAEERQKPLRIEEKGTRVKERQRKTKMTKLMQWLLGGFIFACVWGFLLSSPMSQTCELTRHVVVFLPFYALLVFGVCSSRTNSCHCHREANDLVPEHIVKPHPRCGDGIQQLLKFVVGNNILVTYLYLR